MTRRLPVLLVMAPLVVCPSALGAGDIPDSQDHAIVKRYEGSTIASYSQKGFDEYRLPVGPVVGRGNKAHFPKALKLEGSVTRITYLVPEGRSTLEVFRNYEMELKKAGFTVLFSGAHEAIGQGKFDRAFADAAYSNLETPGGKAKLNMIVSRDDRYLAAKLARPQGDVHVALYVATIADRWGRFVVADPAKRTTAADGQVIAQLDIVEAAPMETNMVTVSAGEMASGIATTGSVALYGLFFDTNSATVKPESAPTLEEIAKLLESQPSLRLLVVGHTDNVGTFEFNRDLSQRRAAAVVEALTTTHAVDPKRLTPVGVSFASPTASNRSDEGRARNRRVELVEHASASP